MYMHMYMYMYMHVYMCMCMHMYMCMYMHVYLCMKQLREAKKHETIVEGHQHIYFPQRRTAQLYAMDLAKHVKTHTSELLQKY